MFTPFDLHRRFFGSNYLELVWTAHNTCQPGINRTYETLPGIQLTILVYQVHEYREYFKTLVQEGSTAKRV